jgi:hypothetical protein
MFERLDDENFMMYALKMYQKKNCIMSEFELDLKHVKYLKRLFRKYKLNKDLKERLIVNHIIILNNVFGPEALVRILFLKIHPSDYDVLKTFLLYLNLLPEMIHGIYGNTIETKDIHIDLEIVKKLREL